MLTDTQNLCYVTHKI